MLEVNGLDKLVALRILIEALRPDEANAPPEEQGRERQPALAGKNRQKTRQARDVVGLSDRSR